MLELTQARTVDAPETYLSWTELLRLAILVKVRLIGVSLFSVWEATEQQAYAGLVHRAVSQLNQKEAACVSRSVRPPASTSLLSGHPRISGRDSCKGGRFVTPRFSFGIKNHLIMHFLEI